MSRLWPPGVTPQTEDDEQTGNVDQSSPAARLRLVGDETDEDVGMPSFEQLYRLHARYVATIALRILGRPEDVDDIVHDTFLQARRALPRLRDPKAVKGWLATITVRVARRWLRRSRLRRLFGADAVEVDELATGRLEPADYDYVHSAYASLSRLATDLRIAWILRRVHGAQLGMVAEMTGCSLATVKRRIAAADKALGMVTP